VPDSVLRVPILSDVPPAAVASPRAPRGTPGGTSPRLQLRLPRSRSDPDPTRGFAPAPKHPPPTTVNTLLVLLGIAAAVALGYALGRMGRRPSAPRPEATPGAAAEPTGASPQSPSTRPPVAPPNLAHDAELHRLVRSHEADAARLRSEVRNRDAALQQLGELAQERHGLFGQLARSRADTARYRQLVIDIENNAPPNLFGPATPDDLKLIVGVGPVLERMLHLLGVTSYRQIARWTERDIDHIDARLPEFPGRIRRDTWVVQARALHQSKYGEKL